MKHSMIVFAAAFLLSGLAQAEEVGTVTADEESDIRVECIRSAIADEVEDEQMKAVVEECVQELLAGRKVLKDKKS